MTIQAGEKRKEKRKERGQKSRLRCAEAIRDRPWPRTKKAGNERGWVTPRKIKLNHKIKHEENLGPPAILGEAPSPPTGPQ